MSLRRNSALAASTASVSPTLGGTCRMKSRTGVQRQTSSQRAEKLSVAAVDPRFRKLLGAFENHRFSAGGGKQRRWIIDGLSSIDILAFRTDIVGVLVITGEPDRRRRRNHRLLRLAANIPGFSAAHGRSRKGQRTCPTFVRHSLATSYRPCDWHRVLVRHSHGL